MIDFEKDAAALGVQDEGLKGLSVLARRAKTLEHECELLEATLKERRESYRKISEEALPEAMAELGLKSFVMDDGSKVDVKPFYSATISAERRAEAYSGCAVTASTTSSKTQSASVSDAAKTSSVLVYWICSARKGTHPSKRRR